MKKINLIKRLWKTYSHEKQKPQRFVRYAAMLIMLLTLGVGQMWAQCSKDQVFYFRPSTSDPDWTSDARFAVCFQDVYGNSSYESWYSCIEVPGDPGTYYAVAPAACYKFFFCRMKGSDSNNSWSNPPKWNQSTQLSWDGTNHYNLFTKKDDGNWDGDCDWGKYAPPMSSVELSKDVVIYGGDGSEGDPYLVATGSTISFTASATSAVTADSQTKYYQFYKKEGAGSRAAWGSNTTTSTKSLTVSGSANVTYAIDVAAQNEYYSTYGTAKTSDVMYFKTVSPFSAILGSFNSWNHSAATWDLSDQGSNNWDATFHLDAGDHTFKVVYDLAHYGKNSTTITRASNSATSLSTSGGDMTITADYSGDYRFRFNTSSKNLTVTYPPSVTWSANSVYVGSEATIAVSVGGVASSQSLKYELFSGATATGDPIATYNGTTSSTTDSHNFAVTPSFGASEVNKTYTVRVTYNGLTSTYTSVVGRKWDIYVHDVQGWGGVKLHKWGTYGGGTTFPGDACSVYNSAPSWYIVTIDGKCNSGFVLSKTGEDSKKTEDLLPSITTYPAGSYYYIHYTNSKYGLTSITPSTPTVTLSVDASRVNVNQFTVTGTITSFGNDGNSAAALKRVGFYLNDGSTTTQHTAYYKSSGTTFATTFTGLTANKTYTVTAFATNVLAEGTSSSENITTLANSDYTIKIQVPHGNAAPKVYAWTAGDSYGATIMENGSYKSQDACDLLFEATTYDWYYCDLNNKYEKFLIYQTGDDDKSTDFTANREADCYWYNPSNSPKAASMACPRLTPHLVVKTAKDGADSYYEMTGDASSVSVDKTLTAGTYYIKVVYNTEYYGKGSDYANTIARTGETSSNSINCTTVGDGYITLTADFDGTYTFAFATSGKDISVTYPEAHVTTFSISTIGTGTSAEPITTSPSITSTHYVPHGTEVTFTAASANEGYTWKGWYSVADPSADYSKNKVESDDEYTVTINAATTIYAVYEEDKHSVTVAKDDTGGGNINTTSVSGVGISTASTTITATPTNNAWRFWYWEVPGDGSITIVGGDNTAPSITINATADSKTIRAHFQPRFALVGSLDETGNPDGGMPVDGEGYTWNNYYAADFTVESYTTPGGGDASITVDLRCARTLLPNKKYKFRVLDRSIWQTRGCTSDDIMEANVNWQLNRTGDGSHDVHIYTAGYGTYTFKITALSNDANLYPSIEVDRQNSHELTRGRKVYYNEGASSGDASDTNGGTLIAHTNENTTGYDIASGQWFAHGSDIEFTATPATGYEVAGWYKDASCETAYVSGSGDATISGVGNTVLTLANCTTSTTVYVKFAEKMTTVALAHNAYGHVQNASSETITSLKAGVYTKPNITAVPNTGYYFSGWTVSPVEGADYTVSGTGEANTTITVTGGGVGATSGQTLTANFVELDKIYFRNENETTGGKLWDVDKMYVYFDVTWADEGGYGGVQTLSNNAEMNPVSAGSRIFWAYVPRSFTTSGHTNVAFSANWMGSGAYPASPYGEFYDGAGAGQGVYRTDYNRYFLNMYVPACTSNTSNNGVSYYSNGYWAKYDTRVSQEAGYYLKEGTKDKQVDIFKATADNSTKLVAKYRFQNSYQHDFFIASAAGKFYKVGSTITNLACTDVDLVDDAATPAGFKITPTSEGYYTFYIEQAGDTMKLSIIYPISPGDYRLLYTYNTDKTHTSDVFKPDNESSTSVKKSMYIDPTNAVSLKLQKCSGLDGSAQPIWTSGVSIPIATNFTEGKGVYEFDMAITDGTGNSSDVTSVALSNVGIYTGPYYIKTDYAPGGWVNYELNALHQNTINFDKNNAKTFDYYHCAWIGDGDKNVKCIIANDYNQQITDTLIGDAILGEDGGKPRQYLAEKANVRFSYNSYTNELKRAYINGATDWKKKFLCVSAGSAVIKDINGDEFDGNSSTFIDNNNWIYMLDLQAQEGARVKLTADYRFNDVDHKQFLIGEDGEGSYDAAYTQEILGGDQGSWQPLRMVYDFKTNHLITAWLATALDEPKVLNTNIMVLRDNQDDARQITLTGTGKITEVDTAYSVVHLTKWYLTNKKKDYSADSTLTPSERQFYWVSFPYEVKISDIFGSMGNYGEDWILQRYDGKKRAEKGFWLESPTNWTFMSKSETLNAFEGYVLTLDLSEFRYISRDQPGKWANNVVDLYLYFPSSASIKNINTQTDYVVNFEDQDQYECIVNRSTEIGGNGEPLGAEYDRTKRDSYWHLIGIPSFAAYNGAKDAAGNVISWTGASAGEIDWKTDNLPFLYEWNKTDNTLAPTSTSNYTFQPMKAYLVQYGDATMTWSTVVAPNVSPVARRKVTANNSRFEEFNLNILRDEKKLDHTYVRLTDNEDVTSDFEFGQDLCKEFKSGANIYTLIDQLEVAGNSLPLNNTETTIVPVGVKIAAEGNYTFSMPEGTNGIGVVLVDNIAGTRMNLALTDYEVSLSAGKIDNRFWLEISPIQQMPTGVELLNGETGANGVRKVMVDGVMYIIRDGRVFDARGNRVK